MGENFPPVRFVTGTDFFCVYGNDNTLRAKTLSRLTDKIRVKHRRAVNTNFIRTCVQHPAYVIQSPNATAYRQRNKYFAGDLFNHMNDSIAIILGGSYIQKSDFIRAFTVIAPGDFYRVSSITNIDKLDALNDAAIIDIQARNNAFG